jgi:hypothetical protein
VKEQGTPIGKAVDLVSDLCERAHEEGISRSSAAQTTLSGYAAIEARARAARTAAESVSRS